ncbi:hypothetical protein ACFWHX_18510, partial [Streptomyces hirsutus]
MNTERPDNDDAGAEAPGSARDTGGASADGVGSGAPRGGPQDDAATPGPAPEAPAPESDGVGGPEEDTGDAGDAGDTVEAGGDRVPENEPGTAPRAGAERPAGGETPVSGAPEAEETKADSPVRAGDTGPSAPKTSDVSAAPGAEPEIPEPEGGATPARDAAVSGGGTPETDGNEDRAPENGAGKGGRGQVPGGGGGGHA